MKFKSVVFHVNGAGVSTEILQEGVRIVRRGDRRYVEGTSFLIHKDYMPDFDNGVLKDGFIPYKPWSVSYIDDDICKDSPKNRKALYLFIFLPFKASVECFCSYKTPSYRSDGVIVFRLLNRGYVIVTWDDFKWKIDNLDGIIRVTNLNAPKVVIKKEDPPSVEQTPPFWESSEEKMYWLARMYWETADGQGLRPSRYCLPPPRLGDRSRYEQRPGSPPRKIFDFDDP